MKNLGFNSVVQQSARWLISLPASLTPDVDSETARQNLDKTSIKPRVLSRIDPITVRERFDNGSMMARVWKYAACLVLMVVLGVGEMWGTDYFFRHWDANNSTHLVDRGSNVHSSYFILNGSISFKISDGSWADANTFGYNSGTLSLNTEYTCKSPGTDLSLTFSNRAYFVQINTSTKKLLISTFAPSAAAPSAVVSGTNKMFYIQGYEGLNYLVNSSKTQASTTTPMNYTGISYVNTASSNLSTYDRISNNPTSWNGDENTNIKTAAGGELFNRDGTKTAAKTATTTTSVSGDVLSISTTTNTTTGVYGSLPLYIQYYVDGTFAGVTYSAATASYGSIPAGGATARASTYNVSSLTNGSHTLKTILTDGIIYWIADQDNFTVAHPYAITYKDQGNVTYSGSNGASLPATYTYGIGVTLVNGVKAGYDFGGWYTASDCSSGLTTSIGTSETGAKTFYAKWTLSATNSLVTAGGVGIASTSGDTDPVTLGSKYAISATLSTGYTFSGWTASPAANGTFDNASSASTNVTVKNGSVTVTASATERMSALSTSCHYDAGNPSYAAPSVSGSATTVGYATTRSITATAAGTGYTFAGWTLTNCTRTDGGAATATTITVRSNGDGAAASVVANYTEDLSTPYIVTGGNKIVTTGTTWRTTADANNSMLKQSGHSTESVAYFTVPVTATNTGDSDANYKFKIYKTTATTNYYGLTASGQYWILRENDNGVARTMSTSGADIELRADVVGDYLIKVDYSSTPTITVYFPLAVTWTAASVYSGDEATITSTVNDIESGKSLKYELFAGATATGDAIATYNTTTTSTSDSHNFAVTPSFGASDISKQYTVKITYNGSQTATYTSYVYRKWDIYVQNNCSWEDGIYYYAFGNGTNASWPGVACTVHSGSWYKVVVDGKYPNFLLNNNDDGEQSNDITTSISTHGAGTYWNFVYASGDSPKKYNLSSVTLSNPTVSLTTYDVISTTQIYVKGTISNYGNDGNSAAEMQEVGFKIGETKYTTTCTDGATFERYITGLTANTSYSVKAYATNLNGTGESSATAHTTRATGSYTIKVRSGVSDPVPYIRAFVYSDESCGGTGLTANAAGNGVAMTLDITGTVYKWYSYSLSNEYQKFYISENGSNETWDQTAPLEATCYWYHSGNAKNDRFGTMSCPYATPRLMIEETAGEEDFTYLEMSTSPSISKTVSLAAKSTYLFKIVYNAEWYGKASVNLSRAANSVTGVSAAIEDNMAITTDVAGDYTFTFTTPGTIAVTYPTAYTVTFGYGTGGSEVTATATNPSGAIASGDYVASGTDVTFTHTPASDGYSFKGWYTTADGNTTVATMGVSDHVLNSLGTNATVYAQYTPNNYTVTFDATTNGGSCATESKSVTYASTYGELPTATKSAQCFMGWYTSASGEGTKVTSETAVSITAAQTLYARFESIYEVTVQYKCGDVTLSAQTKTSASANECAAEISAPEVLGYRFKNWTGSNASFDDASSATTTVTASASTIITANYELIPTVYFKNNLSWDKVYVTFDCSWTAGSNNVPINNSKPYYEMTQLGESDIFYCVIPDAIVDSWKGNIAFDNHGFGATDNVGTKTGGFDAGEFLGRGDFDPAATMFIPYNGDSETRNGGTYYRTGCWMKYNSTDPGYTIYANTHVSGSKGSAVAGTPASLTASRVGGFEFKGKVEFTESDYSYGFMLHKEYEENSDAVWYTNKGAIYSSTNTLPWDFTTDGASENGQRCELHTEATGEYEFTVSFGTGRPVVNVTYPVGTDDYRLIYNDRVAWSGTTHTTDWIHPSRVIKARANAEDTVSFYISRATGANASVKIQKCTGVTDGVATWNAGTTVDISSIEGTGIYNFRIAQNESKEATVSVIGGYNGNFYIRTDASDGGWSNYKTSGTNTMTYSEYSVEHGGGDFGPYSHYYMRYVTKGCNIKFCIANDYSECISDTVASDDYTNEWIEASGNVRFMWYHGTNKIGRAYISGSSVISDRFLVLEGDENMFDENGNILTEAGGGKVEELNDYEMNFTDDLNWIYEATVQAKPGAEIKLTAKYNGKIQYFYGSEDETVALLGGSGETKYTIRIVYDFKTNRLIKAFIPAGAIEDNLSIEADLMIIREHQEDAQQITFNGGKLTDVKTVYGAMKFNKYTINNKSKAEGHALLSPALSRYERDIFYISFPFDVKMSDVFGFGTYGTHWIIEYYDGKGRAKNGYWVDSPSNWKFVLPAQRSNFTLKAFEGYILALDLDEMTEGSSIWSNDVEDVYVYFPSSSDVGNIEATDRAIPIDQTGYECTIERDDRATKDSYWHMIGVPSFANYNSELSPTSGGSAIDWRSTSMPYLYEWNPDNNSLSITTSATFAFKAMYSYLVQYSGTSIYWSAVNATPAAVVARQKEMPTNTEFRLELQLDDQKADQAFIRLTDDEQVTTGFDFNYDLSKEFNKSRANVYTLIADVQAAGNCLPMTEQTTIVPVGVKLATDGDYTFSIPDGTSGVGVTLIDSYTGAHTNLSALDYTVSLEAGTYDDRFLLQISPIHTVTTDVEASDIGDQKADVRKVLIDGLLYIVRDDKMYDARGARVE